MIASIEVVITVSVGVKSVTHWCAADKCLTTGSLGKKSPDMYHWPSSICKYSHHDLKLST